jgi:hypothetical protein
MKVDGAIRIEFGNKGKPDIRGGDNCALSQEK